jgi:putative transposase
MALDPEVACVFTDNFEVYAVSKVWRQLMCECFAIAAARLMRDMGPQGVIRVKVGAHDHQRHDDAVPPPKPTQ